MIPNPVHDFKVKVTDLEFLYWSLCLSFYNVCFCEAFDGLIHVWHGDRNWSKILDGTIPNPDGHRLRIFIQKFCDKMFYNFSFFLQSLQWILFNCGVTIEPYLKFYAVLSQSQCMALRSGSQTLNFFVLNLYSVSCCKAFDWFESCLVWMDKRFWNASERKSASQASCPVRRQSYYILFYEQTMQILSRCCFLRCLIWFCTVCLCPCYGTLGTCGLIYFSYCFRFEQKMVLPSSNVSQSCQKNGKQCRKKWKYLKGVPQSILWNREKE